MFTIRRFFEIKISFILKHNKLSNGNYCFIDNA